ncbi:MAG: translation elongation factor 4 [Patescibacteria group bacterium]
MKHLIRNFVIIAHIDHGKSTLADRLLEATGTVDKRLMKPQYLDQLDLERERGITIKMAPVRMRYTLDAIPYTLNLIDTPGHSDFGYEVSRALMAVEGAVLLVDATQGIQAQTLANYENAKRAGLFIVGAVNKVDVADADQVATARHDIAELIGASEKDIMSVSGKTGDGVPELLEAIVRTVPPPREGKENAPPRALIFDSLYDDHKGVIAFARVFEGSFRPQETAKFLATGSSFKIKEVGFFAPQMKTESVLEEGMIGYVATGIKDADAVKIGDTLTVHADRFLHIDPLPGYREPNPVVFVSFYPEDAGDYDTLRQALSALRLTDSALTFEPDTSEILGRGYKGGFLGRLHFEITAARLEQEFHVETVHSFPSVAYKIKKNADEWITITNPKDFPDEYREVLEPVTDIEIVTPPEYLGAILQLSNIFRFSGLEVKSAGQKTLITAKIPLADLVSDLDDKLKSASEGFASFSYELSGFIPAHVSKMEILVAEQVIPGLTRIIPDDDIQREGRATVEKLKELLPRQQFQQALQASARGRIIARETIPAIRKDVTGYLYGGDRTRKMKLWKKQQRGKKRLEERGTSSQVKIPASIFKELLKR